ncbi:Hypothetical protein NTJ_00814 [Nesidiocoris tenuis]|uniref:Uncharacterized protein n=1 Tax=Nesidiocoris tenuis TaxID=355587 RepID=A0ABN7A719_9HEMI|nr:Hypothetical protein NTJ_00814 [Nesidiocoris tenuis]
MLGKNWGPFPDFEPPNFSVGNAPQSGPPDFGLNWPNGPTDAFGRLSVRLGYLPPDAPAGVAVPAVGIRLSPPTVGRLRSSGSRRQTPRREGFVSAVLATLPCCVYRSVSPRMLLVSPSA